MNTLHKISIIGAGLLMCACNLEPQQTPVEELYMRNFIKQFGLIDPEQDWKLATTSEVYVHLDRHVSKVVVYADIFDDYYRVARCYNVDAGYISIPVDVPVNTRGFVVEIDGKAYQANDEGKVDTAVDQPMGAPASRDGEMTAKPYLDEDADLGWVILAEDLGSVDDIDFNDFVCRLSYSTNNYRVYLNMAPEDWDVIDQTFGDDIYFGRGSEPAVSSRDGGSTVITCKALAAGGIKKLWFHYRESESSTDYVISPLTGGAVATSSIKDDADRHEWHRWFGQVDGKMLNTISYDFGVLAVYYGLTARITVPGEFTFTDYSQAKYESTNPMDIYSFDFDKRTVHGFYITVDECDVLDDAGNQSYDMGKAIGHNADKSLPPQMFLVPDLCHTGSAEGGYSMRSHFRWPLERVNIKDAYSGFPAWVANGDLTTSQWYKAGNSGNTATDAMINAIYK